MKTAATNSPEQSRDHEYSSSSTDEDQRNINILSPVSQTQCRILSPARPAKPPPNINRNLSTTSTSPGGRGAPHSVVKATSSKAPVVANIAQSNTISGANLIDKTSLLNGNIRKAPPARKDDVPTSKYPTSSQNNPDHSSGNHPNGGPAVVSQKAAPTPMVSVVTSIVKAGPPIMAEKHYAVDNNGTTPGVKEPSINAVNVIMKTSEREKKKKEKKKKEKSSATTKSEEGTKKYNTEAKEQDDPVAEDEKRCEDMIGI